MPEKGLFELWKYMYLTSVMHGKITVTAAATRANIIGIV